MTETLKDATFTAYAARGQRPLTRLEQQQHAAMRSAMDRGDEASVNRIVSAMVRQMRTIQTKRTSRKGEEQ